MAIEQIRHALVRGGFLFHVQDVRPGEGTGVREVEHARALRHRSRGRRRSKRRSPFSKKFYPVERFNSASNSNPIFSFEIPGRLYYMNSRLLTSNPVEEASAVVTVARRVE